MPALVFGVSAVLALFVASLVFSVETGSLSKALANSLDESVPAGLVWFFLRLRVSTDKASLRVVNMGYVHVLDAGCIRSLGDERGLYVTLVDGTVVYSSAFGRSVLGDLLGYRRARRAKHVIDDWLDGLPDDVREGQCQHRATLRADIVLVLALSGVFFSTINAVVHSLAR